MSPPTTGLSLFKGLMVLLTTALVSKPSTNHLNVATELHLRATELEATVQGGDMSSASFKTPLINNYVQDDQLLWDIRVGKENVCL